MNVARLYPVDAANPMDARQCTARSKQSGERCKRRPIVGGRVCSFHGGKAPQVVISAAERLAAIVAPAIAELWHLAQTAESEAVRVVALRDLLDRGGLKPKERVEQSGKLVIEVVYGDDDSQGAFEAPALGTAEDQGGSSPVEYS